MTDETFVAMREAPAHLARAFPGVDLLVGEAVYTALKQHAVQPQLSPLMGVSIVKNAWLKPDCILGLTELGKAIVRDCKGA